MAVALIAAPAAAQVTDPATPPDPTVEAQEQPADPEAGVAQTDDAVQTAAGADQAEGAADDDTIVVTGLRRSLRSAQNIKRNSEQIVDAIVAEDIGKLPDIAVSDTAARIPGFQVERERGEAGRVLVRGLDEFFYTTTYNGREIFTAERRSVALQDFPAGGISAIEAFKTSTANLVEPGLAGLVNVRSRRPFDFNGFELAGSVWSGYPNQSRDPKVNAQLLISDRWDAGGGELGALINFSYTRLHYQDSIRRHGFFIADLAGGRSPDWPEIRYNEGDRWRPSINSALQWRPSEDTEIYLEGLWQGYREEVTDRMWSQPLWGGASYSNIVFDEGTNRIISGTVNTPTACCGGNHAWGFQGATKRKTDTFQFALGGRQDLGPLVITGDIARTSSRFDLETESVDFEINRKDYSVNWFTGRPGGSGPTFEVVGIDPEDPANYNYRGFFEDYLTAKGDDWQFRLDGEYELSGISFLPKIQAGVRFVNRDASARGGARYWNFAQRGIPISAVPLDYSLFRPAFRGDDDKPFPTTWPAPTFRSVHDNLTELRQFNINLGGTAFGSNTVDDPAIDPGRTFKIDEESLAGYGQLNYDFTAGAETAISGVVGLRAVNTRTNTKGTLFTPTGTEDIDFQNEYTDWLPNANMNVRFSPEWQLRLAATQTRTRPRFDQLNPALRLEPPPGCTPGGTTDCVRIGRGGNPFLKPLDSNNYDASLEYYFSRNGFASVALFHRDMRGFVATSAIEFPDPDPLTGLPLVITGPVNTGKGKIRGAEAQVSTFFDWEFMPTWARAFGAQANVTYIDAKADFPVFGEERRLRIPDVSKWTTNLVGMYEAGGLTLRLAYNRRSQFPEGGLSLRNGFTLQGRGNPISRLDWSSSYTVTDNFTLFFDWTNILKKPFKSDIVRVNYAAGEPVGESEIFPMVTRFEESIMTGGVRFRFGGGGPRIAAAPAPVLPPPPPPAAAPPPVFEPAPPPPPPPSGQRG
ncbi:TonB-dependent receptor [Sphingomonas sp.]|uniref:TonB-dependent receptor n=1 Tax=Sphingomonas sp. TaxID=28214 RepID=UPI001818269E|nr:TonB-dependent receptor [Sphingomonas sp.]MBA3512056.1 TonB-dependent receptor [Sphingomonas sp.]